MTSARASGALRRAPVPSALLLTIGALCGVVHAAPISAQRVALIVTRAIAYDRNFARLGAPLVIAVVHDRSSERSRRRARAMLAGFSSLQGRTVRRAKIKIAPIAYRDRQALVAQIKRLRVSVLFLCAGLDGHVADIVSTARALKRSTAALRVGYLKRGVALGAFKEGTRIKLMINLRAMRAEGAAYGRRLLELAKLIR